MKTLSDDAVTPEDTSAAELQVTDEGRRAFVDAGYGLSVHWGLYTLYAGSEWIYYNERIRLDTYKEKMAHFTAERFDAEAWADLMLEAGQEFLLITTKHHDGFCMYHTDLTGFNVTNTPFGRDPIAELAQALDDRGLKLGFYYSLVDWTHPAYREDWPAYVDYYQGQVRELMTNYGDIAAVVFDGDWPRQIFETEDEKLYFEPRGRWHLAQTYDLIHELQPHGVVFNNSHILPRPGEDAQVWELDLPGQQRMSFNTSRVGDKLKIVWWNLNAGWSYQPRRHQPKSAAEILRTMEEARRHDGDVFVLNVGPRRWGDIHPDEAAILREIGAARRGYGIA